MSRAESFLRGGTPCTEVPDLVEVLSSAGTTYTHWRFVAYYPQLWLHDAIENRMTAPLYFLVFAACTGKSATSTCHSDLAAKGQPEEGPQAAKLDAVPPHEIDNDAWHLLCHTVLPNGAIPRETFQRSGIDSSAGGGSRESVTSGGGGVGALRTMLRAIPAGLHPACSLEWLSVADGQAYRRMGLVSEAVFEDTLTPAVAEVLSRYWSPRSDPIAGEAKSGLASAVAITHYVHNSQCTATIRLVCERTSAELRPVKSVTADPTVQPFVDRVVRAAVQWMSSPSSATRSFTTDASVPSLPAEGRSLLYSIVSKLPKCLYTSLFVEAEHAGAAHRAPLVDPETLTGMAKLRAERDAGIAQWKQRVGEYTSFTLPECPSSSTRAFQHVIVLQRPIVEKRPIDVDNRDPGPLAPQPIGAELHLLQDRGDVQYTLEQLGNPANIQFLYSDTLPDDGEVMVQLTPVEGTPFCDLEAYFQCVQEDAPVFHSAPASQCACSCCGVVVPRVCYRRPTGNVHKTNPLATAQAEVEVLSPTMEMIQAAVAALQFFGAHVEEIYKDAASSAADGSPSCTLAASPSLVPPSPGYVLKAPPVDLSLVPTKKCGWCGRRREALLRCGSCKTVLYCCKRHQGLDWKEGAHKVECKLWRHARELHERLVVRWAAGTPLTWRTQKSVGDSQEELVHKGNGWSFAATLVQFVQDVEARASRRGAQLAGGFSGDVWNIHIAGFEASCLDEFLRALGDQFCCCASGTHQYRVLLCSDMFSDAQRSAVWAVRRSPGPEQHRVWLTPSTGVLGDAWHCKGDNEAETRSSECMALIRCCCAKYHNVNRASDSSNAPGRVERPCAVLSFGPLNGEGCNYLSAALEVLAEQDVGVVPLRLVDSSYVGAVRTRDALMARISSSDACAAAIKSHASSLVRSAKQRESEELTDDAAQAYLLSAGQQKPFQIMFNDNGAAAQEVAAETPTAGDFDNASSAGSATVGEMQGARAGNAVPHYVNSYVFDVYPSDF
ncbi:hypothetical protein ABL78_2770 [Leptomonas seymouri]|uniref:MYND-type domain-containing protein n=1 Tax=Leptomonas seymouri TaxID=5684 RepID=A0A0N0P7B7_LEPSE|nr:hypothetical protein ABL78_2770 [Leptomonas seymouri]|eukprot:KPI88137.1 hypothetical protein ABL78_2770 [Leptomonas seymouri]